MSLANALLVTAKAQSAMIATAESCTGGLISAAITDIPGSSEIFERGFVTYSNAAKISMLGVEAKTLDAKGAVSEDIAREMAMGALAHSRANISLSVTGIAGPGGTESKPEGRVCFGLATATMSHSETMEFGAIGRDDVRTAARDYGLSLLLRFLTDQ